MAESNPELQAKLQELDNDFAVSRDVPRSAPDGSRVLVHADSRFDCRKATSHTKGTADTPLLPYSKPRRDVPPSVPMVIRPRPHEQSLTLSKLRKAPNRPPLPVPGPRRSRARSKPYAHSCCRRFNPSERWIEISLVRRLDWRATRPKVPGSSFESPTCLCYRSSSLLRCVRSQSFLRALRTSTSYPAPWTRETE